MNTYLVAHYGGIAPTFSYAETLEEARSYALVLLNSQYCKRDNIVSIIEVADDSIIYYGKRDKMIDELTRVGQPTAVVNPSWSLSLKPILNWVGLKLTRLTVG